MSDAKLSADIETYGWHFLNVFDRAGINADFAYSIGFEISFNQPEVIIFGLARDIAKQILADIAHDYAQGVHYEPEKKVSGVLGGDTEVIFKPVIESAFSDYLGRAVDYYGKPFRAWVMLWPDKAGRFPTEPGFKATVQNEALAVI